MLRVGLDNYISLATATATVEPVGHGSESVLDDTVTSWIGTDSCTLTLTWASSKVVDLLTIHRLEIVTNLTVTGKLAMATVFTDVFLPADLNGIDIYSLYTGLSGTIDELVLSFTGTGNPQVGYIWAGSKQDILFESLQIVDQSLDVVSVTMGSFAANSGRPSFREFQLTTAKVAFETIRDFMRNILRRGYGSPRPMIVLADSALVDDAMLGIFDSGKVQYDIFGVVPTREATVTIGLTEVFGGVDGNS